MKKTAIFILISLIAIFFMLYGLSQIELIGKKDSPKDEFFGSSVSIDTINSTINGKLEPMFIEKRSTDQRFYFIRRKSDNATFSIPSTQTFEIGNPVLVTNFHYQMNSWGSQKELLEIFPFEVKNTKR